MLFTKENLQATDKNKTHIVLFLALLFLFSLSLKSFASSAISTASYHNCKKESTLQKAFPSITYDADSAFSIDDIEQENILISTYKIFVYLPIHSINNQSLFLKNCQNRMEINLPLFLEYQDIRL